MKEPPDEGTPYEQALDRALKILGRRAYSKFEMAQRLGRAGFTDETIKSVVGRLTELGLLNDLEVAREEATHSAVNRGESDATIEARLRARGIPQGEARAAIGEIELRESDRALRVATRKASSLKALPRPKAIRRFAGFLTQKGYDPDLVAEMVEKVFRNWDEPEDEFTRTPVPID